MQSYGYNNFQQNWRSATHAHSPIPTASTFSPAPVTPPPPPSVGLQHPTFVLGPPSVMPFPYSVHAYGAYYSAPSLAPLQTPASHVPSLELSLPNSIWYIDTGATTHMASDTGILSSSFNNCSNLLEHVIVGNGSKVHISSHGATCLPKTLFSLSPICVASSIVKNLISVHQLLALIIVLWNLTLMTFL